MRIANFHDYFGAIGGAERLVIAMAKILDADIITMDTEAVQKIDPTVRVVSLGKTISFPPLKQISASVLFILRIVPKTMIFLFSVATGHIIRHAVITPISSIAIHRPAHFYDQYPAIIEKKSFIRRQIARIWIVIHRFFNHQEC